MVQNLINKPSELEHQEEDLLKKQEDENCDQIHRICKIEQKSNLKDMEDYSPSDDSDSGEIETSYQERSSNGYPICRGCMKEIIDKYYLRVNETSWHEDCLKCNYCSINLECEQTCFIKKRQIFCKIDYYKHFGIKCAKCNRNIQSSDWVRRAKDNVYHLACFACENCKRQLSTGEEFALHNNKLLCKTHYCEFIDGDSNDNSKLKNKRVRTTFTEEQLQILQANFDVDSNPDGQDLERIAQITGLSKRVTQVWFQNSRARQKKYKEKKISNSDSNDNISNDDTWLSHTNTNNNNNNSSVATSNNNNNGNLINNSLNDTVSLTGNKKRLHGLAGSNSKHSKLINGLMMQNQSALVNGGNLESDMNLSWSDDSVSDGHILLYDNDSSMDINQD